MNDSTKPNNSTLRGRPMIVFRLYVAGGTQNSMTALSNLTALCTKHWPGRHELEIVDTLKDPIRAMSDHIIATPTLIKVSPAPSIKMIGDLKTEKNLLIALWLEDEI